MAACPNGAEPTPEFAATAVYIQAAAIGAEAIEILTGMWPLAALQSVFAIMPVTNLCTLNPDDPGQLTLETVAAAIITGGTPDPQSVTGTLAKFVYDKAIYNTFAAYCRCKDTLLPPPAPIVITPPTGIPPYPPGPDTDPILRRIEHHQSTSDEALLTLYNGVAYIQAHTAETWQRTVQAYATSSARIQTWTAEGEGSRDLIGVPTSNPQIQDVFGVVVELTAIPPSVARRGTLTPRLYGVGSLYWDASDGSGVFPKTIQQRDSIHYERQFVLAPQRAFNYTVWWRLMPGVRATMYQLDRGVQAPFFLPSMPNPEALPQLAELAFPPNHVDPPFYPIAPERRIFPSAAPP